MIGKRVSGIARRMNRNYSKGKTSYPRVDNNYHQDDGYIRYPHPILKKISPLQKMEYPYSKNTALLELSNNKLLSPSMLFNKNGAIQCFIDKFFKDDMSIKKDKIEEVTRILNDFRLFLVEMEIDESFLEEKIIIQKKASRSVETIKDTLNVVLEKARQVRNLPEIENENIENYINEEEFKSLPASKKIKNIGI